jgi:hypothetical protein
MQQSAHFQMPFILAGEILDTAVFDKGVLFAVKDSTNTDRAVGYTVMVTFPNGSKTTFANVVEACMFGGIGDFFQNRMRTSNDVTYAAPTQESEAEQTITTIGCRVLVAFVGGDTRKPVIVGKLPHPQRALDLPDSTQDVPQAKLAFKGFEAHIDPVGQVVFVSRGAPDESNGKETTESVAREDVGPVDLPERETNTPLPSTSLIPNLPPKMLTKPSLEEPTPNEKLKYPDKKYTSELGFLELGEWYFVDSEGQTIMFDRDSKTITLSNGQDTIQLDKEHKKIFVQTSGDLEVTTQNDYVTSVMGNKHQTITKDEWYAVKGNEQRSVGGSRTSNVVDKDTTKTGSAWEIEVGTAESVEGGTGTAKDKHRASIKLSTGNSFIIDDDNISITHKSGSVITMDKDGKVSIKGSKEVDLDADKIVVTGKTVDIKGGKVTVGEGASMSAVLGENLAEWLDQHIHPTGTGPSGPAAVPTSSFKGSPKDILSGTVKVNK